MAPLCEELDTTTITPLFFSTVYTDGKAIWYQACRFTFIRRKKSTNYCHQSLFFDSNMHQIVYQLTEGVYSAPPDLLEEGRGARKFVICPMKKKLGAYEQQSINAVYEAGQKEQSALTIAVNSRK